MGIVELGLELVCLREANRFERRGGYIEGGGVQVAVAGASCGGRKKLWALEVCLARRFLSWLMLRASPW